MDWRRSCLSFMLLIVGDRETPLWVDGKAEGLTNYGADDHKVGARNVRQYMKEARFSSHEEPRTCSFGCGDRNRGAVEGSGKAEDP